MRLSSGKSKELLNPLGSSPLSPPQQGSAIPDANLKIITVPTQDKRGKSVKKIKDEYYDFFEPDSDPPTEVVPVSASRNITLVELQTPLTEVANVIKPQSGVKPQSLPSPVLASKSKQEKVSVTTTSKRSSTVPMAQASPSKKPVVIDLAKEETKQEKDKEFCNPKWKVDIDKQARGAGFESVWRRVEALDIKPFPLPTHLSEDFLNVHVRRDFLSSKFGGNPQATYPFQRIKDVKAVKRPGYDNFMCPNLVWNPRAPQRAGYPGLFYESGLGNDGNESGAKMHRVFVRLQRNVWLYIGNYEMVRAEPLTRREWLENSDDTRSTWAENTCKSEWGNETRTRIALRKRLGRNPTSKEVQAEADAGKAVTPEQVMAAFDNGEERLQAWVMKCIGYEEDLQRELIEGMKAFKIQKKEKKRKADANPEDGGKKKRVKKAKIDSDTVETLRI